MYKTAREQGIEAGYAQFYEDLEKAAAAKKKGPTKAQVRAKAAMKARIKTLSTKEMAFDKGLKGKRQVGPKIVNRAYGGFAKKYYGEQRRAGRGMFASAGNVAKRLGQREMAFYKKVPMFRSGVRRGLAVGGLAAAATGGAGYLAGRNKD